MVNLINWLALLKENTGGGGGGPITLVTTGFQRSTSSTQQMTISGIQSGDFIIVSRAADTYVANDPPNMTLGHTTGTSYTNVRAGWYYTFSSGTSFTTTVDGDPSANSYRVIWVYSVWRNVNQSNPLNTWAFSYSGSNGIPNPPSITTDVDGCMIVPMMMLDDDDIQDITAPSGYDLAISTATRDQVYTASGATNAHAYLLQSSAGSIDPGTFGSSSVTLDDQWAAYTIALEPA